MTRPPEPVEQSPAPARPCLTCTRELRHEPQVCDHCIRKAQALIQDIASLYRELPDVIGHLAALRQSHTPTEKNPTPAMPGGDALVLMAPGSEGRREQIGVTVKAGDAHSVSAVLGSWEDAWRVQRGETAAPYAPTVRTAVSYLLKHVQWAADASHGFDDFMTELKALRSRMNIVTGRISPPVRSDAECFDDDCHGRLEQHWTAAGLSEERVCPDCKRTYTPDQYRLALKAHLQREQVEPVMTAGLIVSASEKRWGQRITYMHIARWVKRGALAPVGQVAKGKRVLPTYRVSDVLELLIEERDTLKAS